MSDDPGCASIIGACPTGQCRRDVGGLGGSCWRPFPERVTGIDLMERLLGIAAQKVVARLLSGSDTGDLGRVRRSRPTRHPDLASPALATATSPTTRQSPARSRPRERGCCSSASPAPARSIFWPETTAASARCSPWVWVGASMPGPERPGVPPVDAAHRPRVAAPLDPRAPPHVEALPRRQYPIHLDRVTNLAAQRTRPGMSRPGGCGRRTSSGDPEGRVPSPVPSASVPRSQRQETGEPLVVGSWSYSAPEISRVRGAHFGCCQERPLVPPQRCVGVTWGPAALACGGTVARRQR